MIIAGILIFRDRQEKQRYQNALASGDRYLEEMDYEKAEDSYLEAISIDPKQKVHLFSVLPDKRYGGVGAKCLEFAKNEVFSMGGMVLNAGAIHQSVSVRNWYEKNGFKQKEIHRAAYLPFALGIMSCNVGE